MDPFSISSGVVGFISLGLTTAGGIIKYCESYRSREADFAQLKHHAEELESFLSSIHDRTTAPQTLPGDIDTSLQKCRDACDACLNEVKRLNSKYTSHPKPRWKPLKRLKYPFDKAKLDDLRSRLREFHARLLGFMQLVNLDATRDIRSVAVSESAKITLSVETVGREVQSSLSNVQQVVTSAIHTTANHLESSFRRDLGETEVHLMSSLDGNRNQLESSFQHSLGETETHLISYLENNHSALSNQVSLITVTQENQFSSFRQYMDHRLRVLEQNQQEFFTRALSASAEVDKPEEVLNSSNADCRWIRRSAREKMNLGMSERSIFDSLCTCSKMQKRRSTKQHQDGCVYSLKQYDSWTFNRSFRVFRRAVTVACRFEYARMNWARDWRVYPNMTVRMTVPRSSPAFTTMEKISFDLYRHVQDMEELFRDCLVRLKLIFMNGEGWPTDVREDGSNLIHRFLVDCYVFLISAKSYEKTRPIIQFVVALKELGVPIDDDSIFGTPLACIVRTGRGTNPSSLILTHFMGILETEPAPFDRLSDYQVVNILRWRNPELCELIKCNDLTRLVLRRCKPDILDLLRSNHSLIDYNAGPKLTTLHFAVPWPEGLSLLIENAGEPIQSIINGFDGYNSPLHYAINLGELNSVALLLNAGASIDPETFSYLSKLLIEQGEPAEKIMHVVVESLARQRRDLLRIALQYLPKDTIEELQLRNERLLDDKAFAVVEALRRQHAPISTAYEFLKPGSVYHWEYLTARIARKLFEVGFCNINSRLQGYTPLMIQILTAPAYEDYILELIVWFKNHGADFHTPVDIPPDISPAHDAVKTGITTYVSPPRPPIHFLMFRLGRKLTYISEYEDPGQIFTANQPVLSSFFGDDTTDSCICYCAAHGCTPTSKFLIAILEQIRYYRDNGDINETLRVIRCGEPVISEENKSKVSLEYIRLITHWSLGMRHTCCHLDDSPELEQGCNLVHVLDIGEIQEIREEERYLAKRLETLVDEFEKRFQELNVPLSRFMEEYMIPRLEEVKEERDELSAEELHAIRETGVILYED
ncbi:uncharacterized protein F4812DRAFT_459172 [Daldinia caldariorum]|uniref:uncharacterized protein n=1 Tax=Daldinia caldariorum TaxID=326644 RepID=UPI002007CA89|nr:uncharacterized protein F4812DRAFT_459172 [Daldinia caldariorum]KAI1467891.1 hypothetical protein F4812DRAFT_459172 [Daldinia caldariorum]